MSTNVYHAECRSGLSYTLSALSVKSFVDVAIAFFSTHDDIQEVSELINGEAKIHTINELGENVSEIHFCGESNSYQTASL
jgi:hypothetical protein